MPVSGFSVSRAANARPLLGAEVFADCGLARSSGLNLLLIGTRERTDAVVTAFWPRLEGHHWEPGRELILPQRGGLLFLHDVDSLMPSEQERLEGWLTSMPWPAQVVSTARRSILPAIAYGSFREGLYYRLNTICSRVEP